MHLVMLVCVCMHVNKNRLFSALPLENLPNLFRYMYFLTEFKHLQCGLLPPACCTDRANHFFQLDAIPKRKKIFQGCNCSPEIFFFNGTLHLTPYPLGYYSSCLYMYMYASVWLLRLNSTCMLSVHRVCVLWN